MYPVTLLLYVRLANLSPGIFTVAWGALAFFLLPNTPQDVLGFKPEHKQCCEERLLLDIKSRVPELTKFDLKKALSAFTSLHIWLVTLCQFAGGTTFFGLAYFTPSIVKSLAESFDTKLSLAQIQLLTVPPYAVGFLGAIATAWVSDRYQKRGLTGLVMILLAILGWVLFYVAPQDKVGQRYTALILIVTGVYATAPSLSAWIPNNVACHMKRATAIAMSFVSLPLFDSILSSAVLPSLLSHNTGSDNH
jgi:sugar phosphate permease